MVIAEANGKRWVRVRALTAVVNRLEARPD